MRREFRVFPTSCVSAHHVVRSSRRVQSLEDAPVESPSMTFQYLFTQNYLAPLSNNSKSNAADARHRKKRQDASPARCLFIELA